MMPFLPFFENSDRDFGTLGIEIAIIYGPLDPTQNFDKKHGLISTKLNLKILLLPTDLQKGITGVEEKLPAGCPKNPPPHTNRNIFLMFCTYVSLPFSIKFCKKTTKNSQILLLPVRQKLICSLVVKC